jgi:hypothetical protein
MIPVVASLLEEARDTDNAQPRGLSYLDTQIPDALRKVVDRHHQHLASLVESMRSAGISEALVTKSIDVLIDSYRTELSAAALQLNKDSAGE